MRKDWETGAEITRLPSFIVYNKRFCHHLRSGGEVAPLASSFFVAVSAVTTIVVDIVTVDARVTQA